MVLIGVGAVLLATLEYRHDIRILSTQYPGIPRSPLPVAAGFLIAGLGVFGLIVMLFRQ